MITHGRFPEDPRVEKESSSLLDAGYEIYVYANREVTHRPMNSFKGVKVKYFSLRYSPVFLLFTLPKILRDWFLADEIDVAHAQDTPLVLPTILAAMSLDIPVIYDVHEVWHKMVAADRLTPPIEKALLMPWCKISELIGCKSAKTILVTSDEMASYLVEAYHVPLGKIHILRNVCEMFDKSNLPHIRLPENLFKVSYVGNMNSGDLLLEPFIKSAIYLRNKMDFRFYLVGDGKLRQDLEQLAKKWNIEENIEFTGWVLRKRALAYIATSDVCLLPYRQSFNTNLGSPSKLFEYLSFGKPVVSTALTSCVKLLGNAVYFWEPPTAQRLSEIIYELGRNDDLRIRLGKVGRELVKRKYNWSIEEQKILQVYKRIQRK